MFLGIFFRKYLDGIKKSRTFAPAFEQTGATKERVL
jgi:hypothetical protein